jgi:hypothetical protein
MGGGDIISVKTTIKAHIRYLQGKSLDNDCNLWNGGKCGIYDPKEKSGYHNCVGLKNCEYYKGWN